MKFHLFIYTQREGLIKYPTKEYQIHQNPRASKELEKGEKKKKYMTSDCFLISQISSFSFNLRKQVNIIRNGKITIVINFLT